MNNTKIKLKNVRLSFPSLWTTSRFGGEDTGKYEATFILDKQEHVDEILAIKKEMQRLGAEAFKGKLPPDDKLCLKDGDGLDRPEFVGKMTIKAATKRRPLVIDRDKAPLTAEDSHPYAGCYVHGIVTLWAQDNQYGKRINASLEGLQFVRDGEPFGSGGIDADEFDGFGDDEEF